MHFNPKFMFIINLCKVPQRRFMVCPLFIGPINPHCTKTGLFMPIIIIGNMTHHWTSWVTKKTPPILMSSRHIFYYMRIVEGKLDPLRLPTKNHNSTRLIIDLHTLPTFFVSNSTHDRMRDFMLWKIQLFFCPILYFFLIITPGWTCSIIHFLKMLPTCLKGLFFCEDTPFRLR